MVSLGTQVHGSDSCWRAHARAVLGRPVSDVTVVEGMKGLGEEGLKIQSEEQQDLPLWDLILFVPVCGIISPRAFGSLWSPGVCPFASPAVDLGVGK